METTQPEFYWLLHICHEKGVGLFLDGFYSTRSLTQNKEYFRSKGGTKTIICQTDVIYPDAESIYDYLLQDHLTIVKTRGGEVVYKVTDPKVIAKITALILSNT